MPQLFPCISRIYEFARKKGISLVPLRPNIIISSQPLAPNTPTFRTTWGVCHGTTLRGNAAASDHSPRGPTPDPQCRDQRLGVAAAMADQARRPGRRHAERAARYGL